MDKKILSVKTADGKNRVWLASIYDFNCSEHKTIEVSDEVLAELEDIVRKENNYNRNQKNKPKSEEFDEIKIGEMYGICEESFEEQVLENMLFDRLIKECGELHVNRVRLMMCDNMSARAVAAMEGVHHSSIIASVNKVKVLLCEIISNYDEIEI